MREKVRRSVVKAFTWRITATLTTVSIAYFITGKVEAALSIGGAEFLLKLFIGYMHERLWSRSKFGIVNSVEPEYHI